MTQRYVESNPAIRSAAEGCGSLRLRRRLAVPIISILALAFVACSALHRGQPAAGGTLSASASTANTSTEGAPAAESSPSDTGPESSASDASASSGQGENGQPSSPESAGAAGAPPPGATVSISYAHRGDYLASMNVSKFNGAELVETRNLDPQRVASIIRFDGGITVWEIKPETGVFSKLPLVGSGSKYALKSVTYGKLPDHFAQTTPDSGPPEPLEPGQYYVFAAQRASGAMSYEAVRVEDDGSLDAYEAEPRAGTSYLLCCNLSTDFVRPPAPVVPSGPGGNP